MGKDSFEKVLRERYEGTEIQPSERLWTSIEAAIANEEAARYRRGMAYYRWVAAAGIMLIVGYLGYQGYVARSGNEIADQVTVEQPVADHATERESSNQSSQGIQSEENLKTLAEVGESANLEKGNSIIGATQEFDISRGPGNSTASEISPVMAPTTEQESLGDLRIKQRTTQLSSLEEDLLTPDLEGPSLPETISGVVIYPTEKKSEKMVLWAGLNMAPGYFDPNYTQQSSQVVPSNAFGGPSQVSGGEDHKTGFSMAFGVEMGVRLSDRWQISSGVQYLNNNVQSTTDLVLNNRTPVFSSTVESLDLQADESRSNLSFEPTELNNTFQFISIPVQAGYLVLDKKVKLMLNAGVASDVFLKNKISSVDNSLESVTIDPGSDAPFKSVYFNGLLGAQASYEFLPRYLITLEPRYKLAISEFTRSNITYSSLPSSFGIGVGVKYVFK